MGVAVGVSVDVIVVVDDRVVDVIAVDDFLGRRSFMASALAALPLRSANAREETVNCMVECLDFCLCSLAVSYLYWESCSSSS